MEGSTPSVDPHRLKRDWYRGLWKTITDKKDRLQQREEPEIAKRRSLLAPRLEVAVA